MSKSIKIIENLAEDNLIEAKKITESYLNDILSQTLRKEYENIAPSMFVNNVDSNND